MVGFVNVCHIFNGLPTLTAAVKIIGADCVTKSYTNFFDEFERLKGRIRR